MIKPKTCSLLATLLVTISLLSCGTQPAPFAPSAQNVEKDYALEVVVDDCNIEVSPMEIAISALGRRERTLSLLVSTQAPQLLEGTFFTITSINDSMEEYHEVAVPIRDDGSVELDLRPLRLESRGVVGMLEVQLKGVVGSASVGSNIERVYFTGERSLLTFAKYAEDLESLIPVDPFRTEFDDAVRSGELMINEPESEDEPQVERVYVQGYDARPLPSETVNGEEVER